MLTINNIITCILICNTINEIPTNPKLHENNNTAKISVNQLNKCKLTLNWNDAQYLTLGQGGEEKWKNLPTLGIINKLSFSIVSSKNQGTFYLPKKQYLEFLKEYIAPCKLRVDYKLDPSGVLHLLICDTFEDIDGLFYFELELKLTSKSSGEATGEIWIGESYEGRVRNIKFELTPLP